MILIVLSKLFAVLSKLFALIKFIVKYDCDVNFHLFFSFFFFYFFGLFAEIRQTFRRSVFSARWLFGKMAFRRSGFRQSVVHRLNRLLREKGIKIVFFLCEIQSLGVLSEFYFS